MSLVVNKVAELAADVLASVADRLAAAGIDVPTRQYVHSGEVALDCCDQLVVTTAPTGLTHAIPGEQARFDPCSPPRSVTLDVWLTRCVPTLKENGDPPDASDLDASGVVLLTDLWTLPYVLWQGHDEGDWGASCDSVIYGPALPYGPSGGCGGVHASVEVLVI